MRILRMPPPMPDEKIRQVKINRKWERRKPAFSIAMGLQIIKDIEPYRAVGADIAIDGAAPIIGSRREHREFLKRNNYIEVGNEKPQRKVPYYKPVREDLKRALDEVKSRR